MAAPAPSFQDLITSGRAEMILRRAELKARSGDVSYMFLAAAAAMADRLLGYAASRFRATFLDGARGNDLTILALDHWNVQRNPATQALGQVTFSRASSAGGAGTLTSGFVVSTTADSTGQTIQIQTTADATFGALDLTKTVAARAVLPGTAGDVRAAAVTQLVTTSFDSSITVSNAADFAGGADEESDADLRERVRRFPTTLRRGTLDALEYGALTVAGVSTAKAIEGPTGITTVYVADAFGQSNSTLAASVQTELENWRAAGALVYAGQGALYAGAGTNGAGRLIVTVQLTARTGVDVSALVSNVKAAIVARLAKLQIGETLYRSAIQQAVLNVSPGDVVECDVIAPAANLAPASGELIRTTVADVTVS